MSQLLRLINEKFNWKAIKASAAQLHGFFSFCRLTCCGRSLCSSYCDDFSCKTNNLHLNSLFSHRSGKVAHRTAGNWNKNLKCLSWFRDQFSPGGFMMSVFFFYPDCSNDSNRHKSWHQQWAPRLTNVFLTTFTQTHKLQSIIRRFRYSVHPLHRRVNIASGFYRLVIDRSLVLLPEQLMDMCTCLVAVRVLEHNTSPLLLTHTHTLTHEDVVLLTSLNHFTALEQNCGAKPIFDSLFCTKNTQK